MFRRMTLHEVKGRRVCGHCGDVHEVTQPQSVLRVEPSDNVDASISRFLEEERVPYPRCEACGEEGARRQRRFGELPHLLVVHVNKEACFHNGIPAENVVRISGEDFHRIAIVTHLGATPVTGHYTATVCRGGMPFLCDDTRVFARRDLSAQALPNAYIIFLARSRALDANAQPLAGNVSTVAARCDFPHRAARGIVSGAGSDPATMSMPPELSREDKQGGCQKEDNDKYVATPHGKAKRKS
ncbi:ubiquitin carboxyl-terminal hydrolase [bacterium]|nr:ubiquitin carboxyl-terminal hydrolase [bacterium]